MSKQILKHPISGELCEVVKLEQGDVVEATDFYRSATINEQGAPIDKENPGVGCWRLAGQSLVGFPLHQDCNVSFFRFVVIQDA